MNKKAQARFQKVAKSLKSPCYVLDLALLEDNLKILDSVKKQSGAKILLALKGFAFWSSFKLCAKYLDGITASGYFEARLGLEEFRKYNKNAIISVFSPAFSAKEVRKIAPFSNHIIFNSFSQLARFRALVGRKTHIALRLNPLYSEVSPEIYNPCAKFSRLGITPDEFARSVRDFGLKGISGLHFHTHCEQNSDALVRSLEAVERHFGAYLGRVKWVNFGGGHHITRKDYDRALLVKTIRAFRKKYGVEVILEPGEAVGWQCGVLIGEVVDIVRNEINIAITNLSAAAHMPDCLEMPYTPEIFGARIANSSNSPLDLHSADLANFGHSQTPSLASCPKFAENHESQAENPSVVLDKKNGKSINQARQTIEEIAVEVAEFLPNFECETRLGVCEHSKFGKSVQDSPKTKLNKSGAYFYRLGSPTCLAGDIIGDYIFDSPLKIGDKIIIKDMIHYTIVKNNTFNGIPLPCLGILKKNGDFKIIKKFNFNDYKRRNG